MMVLPLRHGSAAQGSIDTRGFDTARHLFLRFGDVDRYHAAVSMRDRYGLAT